MDNILLCRSDGCFDCNLRMFSYNGKLLVVNKDKLEGSKEKIFFVDRGNRSLNNGLSSPVVVQIQVTNRCNLSCKHCYSSSGKPDKKEMSDQEIIGLLIKLRQWGVLKIQWVGGEVFTRKGFLNLVRTAKKLGFEQSLLTNGVFFGLEKSETIIHECWDMFYTIQVSVDDFGENFNLFVQRKSIWDIVCVAINNLSQHKPKNKILSIATIVRPDNILAISKIAQLFNSKADLLRLGKEIPTGRSKNSQHLSVQALFDSWEEVISLRKSELSIRIGHPFDKGNLSKQSILPADWKSDNGARTFMYIASDGKSYPFPLLVNISGFCGGSVLKNSLDEIWRSHPFVLYRNVTREYTGCGGCKKECQVWPRYHFIYDDELHINERPFSHPGCHLI